MGTVIRYWNKTSSSKWEKEGIKKNNQVPYNKIGAQKNDYSKNWSWLTQFYRNA